MKEENLILDISEIKLTCTSLLEQMPCAIGIKNSDSVYVAVNSRVAKLTGFVQAKHMIGIQDKDLHCAASELHEVFISQDKEALVNQKVTNMDISEYSDGQLHVFLSTKTKIIDADQRPFVLFTMTELPVAIIARMMNEISQTSLFCSKDIAASYRIQNTNFIKNESANENANLSKRLSEVLFLILQGKSIKAIGHFLGISPKTAEEHINRLKAVFGCYSKSQLIEKAFALGYANIIPPSLLKLK